ncbi:hypothetical protein FB45DRAFT_930853, partial [Roridomyces roridus]
MDFIDRVATRETLQQKENLVNKLGKSVAVLEARIAELKNEIALCKDKLSPFRRLPPELVVEICHYFAPSRRSGLTRTTGSRVKLPWTLGHICRSWRRIALSLGRLWSFVDCGLTHPYDLDEATLSTPYDEHKEEVYFTQLPVRGYGSMSNSEEAEQEFWELQEGFTIERRLDQIETCVQRSGSRLISLRIDDGVALPILNGVLNHSRRLGELIWNNNPCQFAIDALHGRDLRFLHTLTLIGRSPDPEQLWIPNLTDLTLVDIGMWGQCAHIPWSRLKRYCEQRCTGDDRGMMESYRQFTHLEVLHIDQPQRDYDSDEPGSTPCDFSPRSVCLPYLHTASFIRTSLKVIQLFDMPKLQVYSVEDEWYTPDDLLNRLPPSSSHIDTLRLRYWDTPGHIYGVPDFYSDDDEVLMDVGRLLQMYPYLKNLAINIPQFIANHHISQLIASKEFGRKLEFIRFSSNSLRPGWEWPKLVEMLRTRFQLKTQGGAARLKRFEYLNRSGDRRIVTGLETLRRIEGWDIRVIESPGVDIEDEEF